MTSESLQIVDETKKKKGAPKEGVKEEDNEDDNWLRYSTVDFSLCVLIKCINYANVLKN